MLERMGDDLNKLLEVLYMIFFFWFNGLNKKNACDHFRLLSLQSTEEPVRY